MFQQRLTLNQGTAINHPMQNVSINTHNDLCSHIYEAV